MTFCQHHFEENEPNPEPSPSNLEENEPSQEWAPGSKQPPCDISAKIQWGLSNSFQRLFQAAKLEHSLNKASDPPEAAQLEYSLHKSASETNAALITDTSSDQSAIQSTKSVGSLVAARQNIRSPPRMRAAAGVARAYSNGYATPGYPVSPRPGSPRGTSPHSRTSVSFGGTQVVTSSPRSTNQSQQKAHCETIQKLLEQKNASFWVPLLAEELLYESLPRDNISKLKITFIQNEESQKRFLSVLRAEGGMLSRVRPVWHLTGRAEAADAIEAQGISCAEENCMCGRYGDGGYVATSAAKANAYVDAEGTSKRRHLFLVLALPEKDLICGERGKRATRTAADNPKHPTEYCFVDQTRLHCVCRLDYSWIATGQRLKMHTTPVTFHCRTPRRSRPKQSITTETIRPQFQVDRTSLSLAAKTQNPGCGGKYAPVLNARPRC